MIDASVASLGLLVLGSFGLALMGWIRPQGRPIKIKGRRYL